MYTIKIQWQRVQVRSSPRGYVQIDHDGLGIQVYKTLSDDQKRALVDDEEGWREAMGRLMSEAIDDARAQARKSRN